MIAKCDNCGKPVYVRPAQAHHKHHYCNHTCEWEHRRGRYTVYDNHTDMPVAVNATKEECAKAMGIKASSFGSVRTLCNKGVDKRWTVIDNKEEA